MVRDASAHLTDDGLLFVANDEAHISADIPRDMHTWNTHGPP